MNDFNNENKDQNMVNEIDHVQLKNLFHWSLSYSFTFVVNPVIC